MQFLVPYLFAQTSQIENEIASIKISFAFQDRFTEKSGDQYTRVNIRSRQLCLVLVCMYKSCQSDPTFSKMNNNDSSQVLSSNYTKT